MKREPLDILEESVEIPYCSDKLAGVLAYPLTNRPDSTALIVGPHPLMGGRLENNVIRHVGRGLAEQGLLSLRFRFTEATVSGQVMETFWSTGQAPEDPGRADEAVAALAWLERFNAGKVLLIGYSFGASLLYGLIDERTTGVVLIGPTLVQHDYAELAESGVPKLVFTADNDFATPLAVTQEWFECAADPKRLVIVPAAEHFYRGQEQHLVEEIVEWLPA